MTYAIYVSPSLFSLVLYVICFCFFFSFFFLEQILPNFFYFSSSCPTSISFRYQRCQVFYHILICGKYNQAVLSFLCILKNISASSTLFLNFDQYLILKKRKNKKERKTSVVHNEREAITPACVITFHGVRLETVTSCRRESL